MHRTRRLLGPLVLLLLALAPAVACGASAETTPVVTGDLDVQVWPGAMPGQGVAILALALPEDTKLPARVKIPIPAGTSVDWAGEIGDQASADAERPRTIEQGTAGDYAVFDLLMTRQAQLEVSGLPLTSDNGVYSLTFNFVQTTPANLTGFSVRLPSGATAVKITPVPARDPEKNDLGESLYTLPSAELAEGGSLPVTVSYQLGTAQTPVSSAGGTSPTTLIVVLLAGVVIALLALVVVLRRERREDDGGDT